MDSCTVDDMYIYGGKIESTEMLKEFNGRKIYIEEGEMRITLLETDDECSLKGWKTYNGRIMFFSDDGEMKVNLSIDEKDDTNSDALERGTKIWRLSELNGSQVFVEGDREIRIVLPQNSSILDELREFTRGEVYFTGKGNGKMNFLDVMKSKGFMKNVKEYNCGQVYFSEKQIEVILSHKGLKKLNMRQCGLESKAIMKIKDKSTLMELDLSNNNIIGENDMIHIIKECPNLRKLNMSKCRMLVIGDFNEIPILERLEEFNIGGNKLNCKCIKHIVKHRKLLRLNLEGCGLVEDDLKGIDNLKGLKELFIGDNLISRKDLDRIFKLKELEVLNMFNSKQFNMGYKKKVNIDGIEALSKLKVLDLRNNRLHEKNINEIFELNELRDLRIEDYWAYCGMLRNISNLINLEKLSIWGFRIDENDMEGITSLKNLKELNMLQCYISGEKAFDNIGKLNDSLRLLSIEECNVRKEKCMKKLAELTNLRELRLVITVPFEIFYDVLEKLTCLRVLDIGIIDARKLIKDEKFPSGSLSRLEILKLEYTDVTDEFFKGLSDLVNLKELVNLREFSLTCSKVKNVEKLAIFDISVFPSGLRKLKLSGGYNCSFDLQSSSRKDAVEIFESLEELELHNIEDISEGIVSEINNCTKLRKLKLRIDTSKNFKADLKGISDIVTLEELVLEKVDLSSEDIVQLSCLEQLRRLKVCNCNLNDKYLNEIGKLKSLEALDIQKNNTISCSMNEILGLKNLRELSADVIWFDYDKQGDFEVVKGFERLKYDKWEIYRNNNRIGHENANFKDVLEKIGKEATINNWKGVTEWKCSRIKIDSVIFLAISSKLVFIESIYSHLDDELRIHEGETEILNNCQMIKKITLVNTEDRVFLPLSIVINIICDNSYLQVVDMSVDELNIDFADLLLECTRIHTIKFRVKKYTDGFFATLLKKPKETGLRSIEVYYCNYENENCKGKVICLNSKDSDIREKIIKYINEEDADAIIRAREENVFTSVYFYTA
ncbi:hypothetical protein PAEPH01_1438 [Pancytospora epiphaga]|nr:hypothetical protein PAEPH01_1438 [Pancytospora epiphaga]